MQVTKLIPFCLLFLAGCVPSLNAIYSSDDLVERPEIRGAFEGAEGEVLVFVGPDEGGLYRLTVVNPENQAVAMDAGLTEIAGVLYLDIAPSTPEIFASNEAVALHLERFHTFYRAEIEADALTLLEANLTWLSNHLDETPDALAHFVGDGLHLTADTESLRSFIAGNPSLFSGQPTVFNRVE